MTSAQTKATALLLNQAKLTYRRALISLVSALLGLLLSAGACAVSQGNLWLPKKYQHLYPNLLYAAQLAEASNDCALVTSGQIDEQRSSADRPVFNIKCRGYDGITFAVRVEDFSDDRKPSIIVRASTGEPLDYSVAEQAAQAEAEPAEPRVLPGFEKEMAGPQTIDVDEGWQICLAGIQRKSRNMQGKVFYDDPRPEPELLDNGNLVFELAFDARSPGGQPLLYLAVCTVLDNGLHVVKITTREAEFPLPEPQPGKALQAPGMPASEPAVVAAQPDSMADGGASEPASQASLPPSAGPAPAGQHSVERTVQQDAAGAAQKPAAPKKPSSGKTGLTDDGWEILSP